MNLGLCDGVLLARALAADDGAGAAFAAYDRTRRAAATAVIGATERMSTLYTGRLSSTWIAQKTMNWLVWIFFSIPGVQAAVAWRVSGLVYRDAK